jgi:MFS family permease
LWAGSAAGNLGDGIGRIAIALLAARLTRDPVAVAAVTALSYLPWLVFGLPAGVLVDRYDRRRLAALAGVLRTAAILALVAVSATGHASLWLLYGVVLALCTYETVYDNAVSAMVPMVVADRDDLDRANGYLQGARLVTDNFLGPPLAGIVFTLAAAYAFGLTAACYGLAALLLPTLPGSYRAGRDRSTPPAPRRSMRGEMAESIRYVWGHALHRPLLGLLMVLGFSGAMVNATMVLWVQDVLGVPEALYGVFGLTIAAGALAGSQTAAMVARRAGRGRALWLSIAAAGVGALVAASTSSPYAAGAGLAAVGWGTLVFNVVNASLRQRLTPPPLLGRVTGVYLGTAVGVMVAGAVAGGVLASIGGLRLPWLGCGLGCLAVSAWMMRRLTNADLDRAVADADLVTTATAATGPSAGGRDREAGESRP